MANGLIIPSKVVWKEVMVLGGVAFEGEFEVFDSKGGWAFLFGKPLMQAAHANHDFETDIVRICSESGTITLTNQINELAAEHAVALGVSLTLDVKQWGTRKGGSSGQNPPLRQVFDPQPSVTTEQIDKHEHTTESDTRNDALPIATWELQECEISIPILNPTRLTKIKTEAGRQSSEAEGVKGSDRNVMETGGEDDTPTREVLPTIVNVEPPCQTDTLTAQMNVSN